VDDPHPTSVTALDHDHRGSRRLAGREEWLWYVVAAVSYVGVGMFHKFVLNWIIGPLWLVAVVVIGPAVRERWRHRRSEP
jgi:hypothetical protein